MGMTSSCVDKQTNTFIFLHNLLILTLPLYFCFSFTPGSLTPL